MGLLYFLYCRNTRYNVSSVIGSINEFYDLNVQQFQYCVYHGHLEETPPSCERIRTHGQYMSYKHCSSWIQDSDRILGNIVHMLESIILPYQVVGRIYTVFLVGVAIGWLPILEEIKGSQFWNYSQSIGSFMLPPIVVTFLLGIFWTRTTEKVTIYWWKSETNVHHDTIHNAYLVIEPNQSNHSFVS